MRKNLVTEQLSQFSHSAIRTSPVPVKNPPKIIALVIGINRYTGNVFEYNNLTGAVGDADAFERFLTTRLQVPRENIRSLRDEEASRDGILHGFYFLRDNQKYKKNEAEIIIYYAGHGAQESIPVDWTGWYTPTGRIEMLCPSDIGTQKTDAKSGKFTVVGIPDRTISSLLNQISSRQGNHTTVIMDCCSSAGMNRGSSTGSRRYIPRQMFNTPPFSGGVDKQILEMEAGNMQNNRDTLSMFYGSHVLLAACGREQMAWEDPKSKRGLFTYNLLKILMSNELETLTYRSLMDKLTMPKNQTPHCEGRGVNRLLFGNKGDVSDTAFIYANRTPDGKTTLEAGSAQGITVDSLFAVHRTDLLDNSFAPNPSLGILIATSVNAFSSSLEPPPSSHRFRPPRRFYCKLIGGAPRSIALYSKDASWLRPIFLSPDRPTPLVDIIDDPAKCHLELTLLDNDTITIDRHNDAVIQYIGSRIPYTVNKRDLRRVISAARHFHYHLTRTAPVDASDVRMELRVLEAETFDLYPDYRPVGENLLCKDPATIQVEDDQCFGINIINDSDTVLYPYLFYFDPNDFTIAEIYTPPLGAGHGRLISNMEIQQFLQPSPTTEPNGPNNSVQLKIGVDGPLPPKAHLTIGYGNGGCKPWSFYVPDGKSKDVGFLRLFLSTRPANFQNIVQRSPFEESRGGGKSERVDVEDVGKWMAKTATVVQVPMWT
ncbi:hypothetical protein BDN70DRAFT_884284 [Pholiota conissans]|uniref:Peptidase C14 caspase domain-containing protein n=1 Tax=Pholiota conissans TaxID=109636 RepID=A0A9P5YUH0_9AGAR|nr:hypothetical protein BDN70DRAFT_884284 [Pholiota conissans]